MSKKKATKRPTRSIEHVAQQSAFQRHQHISTSSVNQERELTIFKLRQLDERIDGLENALRVAKRMRRELAGHEGGLNAVLEVRGSTIVSA